ncbi:MAG: hypothetical protein ACOC7T_00305 [Planctomycetota bacterium]
MSESTDHNLRTEAAVLFLLGVVLVPVGILLGWGRAFGAVVPEAGAQAASEPEGADAVFPAAGGRWSSEVDGEDAEHLMGLFLDAVAAEDAPSPPGAVSAEAPLFVTAYGPRARRFRTAVGAGNLEEGVLRAAARLANRYDGNVETGGLRVRIDIVQEARPFPLEQRLAFAERKFGAPAGVAVEGADQVHYLLPADVVHTPADTHLDLLSTACRRAGVGALEWKDEGRRMWLLEVRGFVNAAPGQPAALRSDRGLTPVGSVSTARLLRAVRMGGDYLSSARAESGLFPTFLNPVADLKGGCQSLTDQASATAALAALGEMRPREDQLSAAYEALSALMHYTDMDADNPRMAFSTREEECGDVRELAASARVLEAMCRYRRAGGEDAPDPWIYALANFLLFMQRNDGLFDLKYDPESGSKLTPKRAEGDAAPQAAAVKALVLAHRELEAPNALVAARKALDALVQQENASGEWSAEEAAELVEAVLEYSRFMPAERGLELARRIARHRRTRQLTESGAPAADLVGGTLEEFPPPAEATAQDLRVFASMCLLEPEADPANLRAAERSARYLLGLQYLPENSYYLKRPSAGRGGLREQPAMSLIRLRTMDSALRGLSTLIRARLQDNEPSDRESAD